MDTSIFLAQFFGWYMIIMGVIILVRGEAFLEELLKEIEDKGFLLLGGYLTLFLGLGMVILHNIWTEDWRVIITILGWLTLLKGILLIAFSKEYLKFVLPFTKNPRLTRILTLIVIPLGAGLIWLSS